MIAKIVFFCWFLFAYCPTWASIKPVLQVLTVSDNYPYNFLKEGDIKGIGVDAVIELEKRIGLSFKIDIVPWSRALITAKNQPNILLFSVARTPEREDEFFWFGPIAHSDEWFYKLSARSDIAAQSIDDVTRFRVGLVNYKSTIPYLTRMGIEIDTAPDDRSNCRKLKYGRIDLVMINSEGLETFLGLCDLKKSEVERSVFVKSADLYMVLGKNSDPNLVAHLYEQFAQMDKEKIVERINANWLNNEKFLRK
jgi:polar amino acid transport system substrate-binding protein